MPSNLSRFTFTKSLQKNNRGGNEWRRLSSRPRTSGAFASDHCEDETKKRANSHRRSPLNSAEEDKMEQEQLFHTICGSSDIGYLMSNTSNINWFVLQESVLDMFKNEGRLEDGKLRKTHEIVKLLLDSNVSIYVHDRFKSQLLPRAMTIIKSKVDESDYLSTLESAWQVFFAKILPILDCMLYLIEQKSPKSLSIRKTSIVAFRDHIIIAGPLQETLQRELENGHKISDAIVHMVLVMQAVFECFPPSKNKLEMEEIAALTVSPYLGYRGLFENRNNRIPVVCSNEPDDAMKKLSTLQVPSIRVSNNGNQQRLSAAMRKISLQPLIEKSVDGAFISR